MRFFASRRQVALRIGHLFFGVRSAAMRELYSERNRIRWRVLYLPLGWRAFFRSGR